MMPTGCGVSFGERRMFRNQVELLVAQCRELLSATGLYTLKWLKRW